MEFALNLFGIHVNFKHNDDGIIYVCKTKEHNRLTVFFGKYIAQFPQENKSEGFKNIMTFEAFKRQVQLVEE